MPTQLRIRLLGDLQIVRDEQRLELPQSRKTRALLGYLAVTGTPERRERLCDLIWDGPSDPRAALRWSLTKLREAVDDDAVVRITADRERVGFKANGADVDLYELRDRLRGGVANASTDDLRAAATLLNGELLAGLDLPDAYAYSAWLASERDALRRIRSDVLTALITRLRDEPNDALAFARQRLAADPFNDDAHASAIELLGALGRVREAMDAYDESVRVLKRELGRAPSAVVERARTRAERGAEGSVAVRADSIDMRGALRRPPLVGRDAEVAALRSVAHGTSSSRVLLVTGEPGIGKSRLLEELNGIVGAAGGTVMAGRAFEAEMIRPYGPWIDALQSLFDGPSSRAARSALDTVGASALAVLIPNLVPERSPEIAVDRNKLFAAVSQLLEALARTAGPVAVALDDLQWFDDASLALLHYVARGGGAAIIALAARPHELEARAAALTVVRALRRDGLTRDLTLGPLSGDDVAKLTAFIDSRLDASQVAQASEGNPLFALEVARNLAAGNAGVPATLEAIIDERLGHLGHPAREIVIWAAALGGAFSPTTLAHVGKFDDDTLLAALDELERAGVVRGTGSAAYDFSHDLIRRVSYDRMSAARAAAVHLAIARRLEAIGDPECSSDIAAHAVLGADPRLAAIAFARAAERSIRLFALSDACALARRGLAALDQDAARSAIERNEYVVLSVNLYSPLVHAGGARGFEKQVQRELERLAGEARVLRLHAQAQTAFYLISYIHFLAGEWSLVEVDTQRAVEAGRAAGSETAVRSLANSGRCLASIERELPLAEEFLAEAEHGAAAMGLELTDLAWGQGILAHHRGDLDAAVSHFETAVTIARARSEHWPVCDCLVRLASIELERGRYGPTRSYCAELAPVAAKLGDSSERPLGIALDALAAVRMGESAEDRLRSAIDQLIALDAKGARSYVLVSTAEWRWTQGQTELAVALAREALDAATAVGRKSESAMARVIIARAELTAGRTAEADELTALVDADAAIPRALSARAIEWGRALRAERSRNTTVAPTVTATLSP